MNVHGQLDFRLTSLYQAWSKADDPPSRVKPLPLGLLHQTVRLALADNTPAALAAADCLFIGYFFLLRPGERVHQSARDRDLHPVSPAGPPIVDRLPGLGDFRLHSSGTPGIHLRHSHLYPTEERGPQRDGWSRSFRPPRPLPCPSPRLARHCLTATSRITFHLPQCLPCVPQLPAGLSNTFSPSTSRGDSVPRLPSIPTRQLLLRTSRRALRAREATWPCFAPASTAIALSSSGDGAPKNYIDIRTSRPNPS